tara:strand:- start:391 stop:1002 length:612 start_codon:yes stop_codon:yes gene_type:complete
MYPYLYNFIQKIILKKSLNSDAGNLLKNIKFQNIIDIGCGEADVHNYFKLNNNQKYFGYEIENYFIQKLKKKYNKKNFYFLKKNINQINFKKFNAKKTIILLIGIFHHLDDRTIKTFLSKTKNFKIISIDAVVLPSQGLITRLLFFLDKGNFIRKLSEYKKIVKGFEYQILHNRYLRFPYDHLMCFKNIKKKDINKALRIENN